MAENVFHRSLLAISSVSLIGSCETRFMEAMVGKPKVTKQMQIGKVMHEKLAAPLPKITIEEVIEKIKSGGTGGVRELPVTDKINRLIGRIDQLELMGRNAKGVNNALIIDDKYPKFKFNEMPLYYKLQLSAYAVAIKNSEVFGSICDIVGLRLISREPGSHVITGTFDVEGEELAQCKSNVAEAANEAWQLYDRKREPEHRRFDVGKGEWVRCYCSLGKAGLGWS
ncbi:MAG: PD-(D/E)XK nuclease family protein [Candidatus Micrarchaeota archaeon]|nr:PD-(D/E)XK nuclease family protein [Candidatus Micrarchaeota archaeon]